jgi:peptide deformylase
MALMQITIYGNEVLRKKTRFVKVFDKRLNKIIQDMFHSMYKFNGIGLAGPQVGLSRKIIVLDTQEEGEKFAMANPKIVWTSEEEDTMNEGCLSIPDVEGDVTRSESIRVRFNDPDNGEEKEMEASGLLARVIQHETDHLNGVMFVDHLSEKDKRDNARKLQELAVV